MTSFWLTRESVSSLTFLSNLIPLITLLAWLLWQYPLVVLHLPSLLLFQHLFRAVAFPLSMGLSQSNYRFLFSHCTFFFPSCFLLLCPDWIFSSTCPLCFCPFLWVELTVWCIQDDSLSPKAKRITGNPLVWTCHSSSFAHRCWQLHHFHSAFKLRVSFDISLHISMHLNNHGRLATRPVGIRGVFLVWTQKFMQSSKHHILPSPLTPFFSTIHTLTTYVAIFSSLDNALQLPNTCQEHPSDIPLSVLSSGLCPASWWTSCSITIVRRLDSSNQLR